ncbi:MAG: acyltransferase, partial [Burkholderiaceae bacterium]|nr:acyltransferase [Burkholderiaceae bacterium]
KVRRIIVRVRSLPIPQHLMHGDYAQDPAFREAFSQWVQQLWREKDAQIDALLAAQPVPAKP